MILGAYGKNHDTMNLKSKIKLELDDACKTFGLNHIKTQQPLRK